MSTNSEAAPEQIVNTNAPTKAEALVIQIAINEEKNEHQQNINAATSSPTLDDTSQNNKETNGESAPIPRPKKKTTVELTPAPTVKSINVAIDDNEEDDYASKKVVVANYTGNKYVHPGPMTSSLPKPPNNHHSHNKTNINTARKPSNCLCFELKHIQRDFKGNNYIVCNGLFLCGTDMATYITTWILMNIPSAFFYWAQFAYLPQHGIPFFVLCLAVSFTCHFICCIYLVRTNMTDPGILPRFTASEPMHGPFNQHDRFCKTCNIIRPIHAKHCRTCNNCVNGFDHHCPWTGTCVAERNIRYFVGFVTFAGLYGACAFLVSISILINRPGLKELNPMASVGIIIIAGYGSIMSCMLVSMGGSYMCMVGEQLTTNEKIKHGGRLMTDAEKLNPQNISGSKIYCDAFCRKLPESQIYE